MPNCLGIYIENNIIKYAKVNKDHDDYKVESFGIKCYDKLEETLDQIISETYSFKIPISINVSEESYNYFEVFSLLNKKDLKSALATEFELFCSEKGFDINVLESRYLLTKDAENKEKIKAMYISVNKAELAKKVQQMQDYKLSSLLPLPVAIKELVEFNKNENSVIINIEEKSTITLIIDGQIYKVQVLKNGMDEILSKINLKENSFSKAYEICKNTTIYTSEGKELQDTESEYLEDIMPTLYNIITEVQEALELEIVDFNKIYLTGTAAIINNIDLYFQEYFPNSTVEILKPYFLEDVTGTINIKDYIEVNSAIALAIRNLTTDKTYEINFKAPALADKLPDWLKVQLPSSMTNSSKKDKINLSKIFKLNLHFSKGYDTVEKMLMRACAGVLLLTVAFGIFSKITTTKIDEKVLETDKVITSTNEQISEISNNTDILKTKNNYYMNLIDEIRSKDDELIQTYETKKAIPNLLSQLMAVIPVNLQITSIKNTADRHIVIDVQAENYDPIGYFIGSIKNRYILDEVYSSNPIKQETVVKVTVEGELP